MAEHLMTFGMGQDWLRRRAALPNNLSHAELMMAADFPAKLRAHALWSARVSSMTVLNRLQGTIQKLAAGDTDVASARVELKDFLRRQGYTPDAANVTDDRRSITNLASTRRLDLILRTNVGLAHAVGQREVSMQPSVMARWPYLKYNARADARPTHRQLDGLVLPKGDPFWDTHWPPWEFLCRCSVEDADEAEYEAAVKEHGAMVFEPDGENPDGFIRGVLKMNGRNIQVLPNESKFLFRSDAAFESPNWDGIPDGPLKRALRTRMRALDERAEGMRALIARRLARHPQAQQIADEMPPRVLAELDSAPVYDLAERDGAWHEGGRMYLSSDPDSYYGQPFQVHHETGHFVHRQFGIVTDDYVDREFAAALEADRSRWEAWAKRKYGSDWQRVFEAGRQDPMAVDDFATDYVGTDVYATDEASFRTSSWLDMIGGLTDGDYGAGHALPEYHDHHGAAAHAFASGYTAAVEGWHEYDVHFPATMAYIRKRIGL